MELNEAKEWLCEQTKKLSMEKYGIPVERVGFCDMNKDPIRATMGHTSAGIQIKKDLSVARVLYDEHFVELFKDKKEVLYATMAHELAHIGSKIKGTYLDDELEQVFHTKESEDVAKELYGLELGDPEFWGDEPAEPKLERFAQFYSALYALKEKRKPRTWKCTR
jgi:hypothetical protein